MVGIGESYLSAFVLAMGFTQQSAAMVAVVPILVGSILQLFAPFGVRRVGSRQRWVVTCTCAQALCLIGLSLIAFSAAPLKEVEVYIYLLASMYWGAHLSANPAWTSWIGNVVPEKERVDFFTVRSRYGQVCILLGLIAGGLILNSAVASHERLAMFSILFAVAGVCRIGSSICVALQCNEQKQRLFKVPDSPRGGGRIMLRKTAAVPMIWFLFLTNVAVYVSAPYFSPFMLIQLKFSYFEFMVALSAAFTGRVVGGYIFQSVIGSLGIRGLLIFGAVSVVVTPLIWIFSTHFLYILAIQFAAGVAWGAHELGFTLVLLDELAEFERSKMLVLANLINSIGMFLGTCLGSVVISEGSGLDDYYRIFTASTALRLLPLLLLPAVIQRSVNIKEIFFRILSVRPGTTGISKPVLLTSDTENVTQEQAYQKVS